MLSGDLHLPVLLPMLLPVLSVRYVAELIGVAVFAASGVLRAGRKGMDIIGVSVIAVVPGLGGGTVRDVLIDRRPISWIADPRLLWVCLFSTLVTILWVRRRMPPLRLLLIADALGLALFSIGGVQIAEQVGLGGRVGRRVGGRVSGRVSGCA